MSDKKFVDGLIIKKPRDGAPDYVKAAISIKRESLITWLQNESDEWINIDCKESRAGGWDTEVNTYKKPAKQPADNGGETVAPDFDDSIPF